MEAEEIKVEAGKDEVVETPSKFKALVEGIEKMSVLELHELVKFLEKKFGVSAAAVAVAAPAGGGAEVETKDAFTVVLAAAGEQKIAVIKVIKEALGLGLKESKDLVDGVPSVLKEGVKKAEADDLKKKIEEAGGKVELK
jgi:large subunit ribosomal protein L7/L12